MDKYLFPLSYFFFLGGGGGSQWGGVLSFSAPTLYLPMYVFFDVHVSLVASTDVSMNMSKPGF